MNPTDVNYFAVAVAALSTFLIGGVWYSPLLFAGSWARLAGLSEEELQRGSLLKIFGGALAIAVLMALNLAMFIGPDAGLGFGAFAGVAAGLGWVAAAMAITYLFERRPWRLLAINGGYHVVAFACMGAILGLWAPAGPSPASANEDAMQTYYAVLLRRGPSWTAAQSPELQQLHQAHLSNLRRLAKDGHLRTAGPFLEQEGDGAYAGLLVLAVDSRAQAESLVRADPAVQAGRFDYEVLPWMSEANLRAGPTSRTRAAP